MRSSTATHSMTAMGGSGQCATRATIPSAAACRSCSCRAARTADNHSSRLPQLSGHSSGAAVGHCKPRRTQAQATCTRRAEWRTRGRCVRPAAAQLLWLTRVITWYGCEAVRAQWGAAGWRTDAVRVDGADAPVREVVAALACPCLGPEGVGGGHVTPHGMGNALQAVAAITLVAQRQTPPQQAQCAAVLVGDHSLLPAQQTVRTADRGMDFSLTVDAKVATAGGTLANAARRALADDTHARHTVGDRRVLARTARHRGQCRPRITTHAVLKANGTLHAGLTPTSTFRHHCRFRDRGLRPVSRRSPGGTSYLLASRGRRGYAGCCCGSQDWTFFP